MRVYIFVWLRPVLVNSRIADESSVRTSSSSRESPRTSATRDGLPLVPLFERVPVAVSWFPRVQSSMVTSWAAEPLTICVVPSGSHRMLMLVPGMGPG